MSNVLAIAHKELKSYFASPIAYVVIGLFALVFGFFYYIGVAFFVQQSAQMMGTQGGPTQNVNEQVIRGLFLNASVILLFVLPMITMRTYSEEKRSGTIELLLTSPLTDLEIIMGKFLGAMALYAAMLAVTVIHVGVLFALGNPEWKPVVTSYVGLLLMGGCVHRHRAADLQLHAKPDRRGNGDICRRAAWLGDQLGRYAGRPDGPSDSRLSGHHQPP